MDENAEQLMRVVHDSIEYCHFEGYIGFFIGVIQYLPFFISIGQFAVSAYTGEIAFALFGWYLTATGWSIYGLQHLFKSPLPDERCIPRFLSEYGLPCTQAFHVYSVCSAVLAYHYLWGPFWIKPYYHAWIMIVAVAMPTILISLNMYTGLQVTISIVAAIPLAIAFVVLLRYVITPALPYLLQSGLLRLLLGYKKDSYLMTECQRRLYERLRRERELQKASGTAPVCFEVFW